MQLNIVPARTGLNWARQGIRTFWRQPLAMSGLFFLFMAVVSVMSIVPVIGGALALVLLPALTLGMMAATEAAEDQRFPMPGLLFAALKPAAPRRAMLQLGAWYALGFLIIMGVSVLVDGGIRRGTDLFKALALGADAALIGRPALYGLAHAGARGVAHVLRLMRDEFEMTLALCGCTMPQAITRDHLQALGMGSRSEHQQRNREQTFERRTHADSFSMTTD